MQVSDFMPSVELMAPDAEPLQLQEAIRHAVVRFMTESQVFTAYWTIPVQECVDEYFIDLPECRRLVGIIGVTRNGTPFDSWARDDHEDVIKLFDQPGPCDCFEMKYSWKIGRDDCEIPDKLYEDYLPAVQQAALATLHSMFGTAVVSASRAAIAEAKYQDILADVKGRKVFNFSHSRPRMHRRRGHRSVW